MKQRVKAILQRVSPRLAEYLHVVRLRRHIERLESRLGLDKLSEKFVRDRGPTIQDGPFAGIRYIDRTCGSAFLPKLVGSYEAELFPVLKKIIQKNYSTVIDVGCAEGYYAVGLAKCSKQSQVHAFDIDGVARSRCKELAKLNDVEDRVHVHARCDVLELERYIQPSTLLLCDCEGYERTLLDPDRSPALKQADILVELHEVPEPGVTQELIARFKDTHDIDLIHTSTRDPSRYPSIQHLSSEEQHLAVNELRGGPQAWGYFVAR